MFTFFVYDTAYCKADEDDPKDAVVFFSPVEVYENQCYSLCYQIAGIAKFLKTTFSCPSLITLDQGKFALHWSGKYLFALGENEDSQGTVLKRQLLFLCGIFCFYHGSINNLLRICKNDRKEFLIQMELAWSRYISLSQCFNNLLDVPVNAIPLPFAKKYAVAVSKANELLCMCQLSTAVIAGAVYCNGRVVLSQLSPELTSYLTLMLNENASSHVSKVPCPVKNLPPCVELKYVYLSQRTIQSIIRHNHAHVGSSVRVKIERKAQKSQSSNCYGNVTSGSEGDVDSGHCTEKVYQKEKSTLSASKSETFSYLKYNLKSLLSCCAMHAAVFKSDLLKCRNRSFRKYMNSEFISEKLKIFERKTNIHFNTNKRTNSYKDKQEVILDNQVLSCNLLCHYHADVFSETFLSNQLYDHLNLSSTCDLEYSCYFCINHRFSTNLLPLLSKDWNSEMQIPDYIHNIPLKPQIMECASDKPKKEKTSKCKIQILKCRTKAGACIHCTKRCNSSHSRSHASKYQMSHLHKSSCYSEDYWENIENNDLEKSLLYVQRCENNMVLFIMNKAFDENVLTFLYNCGFTFLKDLDYHTEGKTGESNGMDTVSYILMYDNIQKVLKERPIYQPSLFAERMMKNSVLSIQDDFQSNPKIKMFSLLSSNESVFAYQSKQHSAFYLQQDLNSRKCDSLCNLSKKAGRRLEKYLNLS